MDNFWLMLYVLVLKPWKNVDSITEKQLLYTENKFCKLTARVVPCQVNMFMYCIFRQISIDLSTSQLELYN